MPELDMLDVGVWTLLTRSQEFNEAESTCSDVYDQRDYCRWHNVRPTSSNQLLNSQLRP